MAKRGNGLRHTVDMHDKFKLFKWLSDDEAKALLPKLSVEQMASRATKALGFVVSRAVMLRAVRACGLEPMREPRQRQAISGAVATIALQSAVSRIEAIEARLTKLETSLGA